jgi:hypothetical protein
LRREERHGENEKMIIEREREKEKEKEKEKERERERGGKNGE